MARELIIGSFDPATPYQINISEDAQTEGPMKLAFDSGPMVHPMQHLHRLQILELEFNDGDLMQLFSLLEVSPHLVDLTLSLGSALDITPSMNHICLPHLRLLELKCHPLRIQLLDHISAPHIEQVHIHAEHPSIPEFDLAPLYSFVGLRPTSCYTTESATLEFGDAYEVRISLEITHHIPSLSNLHSSLVFMSYSEDHMDVERVCESIPFRGLHLLDIKQDFSPDEDGCITSTTCYPPDIWIRPFQHFPTIEKICMETYDAVDTLTTILELDTSLFPALHCLEIKDVDFSSEVCHFLNFTEYLRKRMEKGYRLQELILHTMDKPIDKLQWAMLSRLVGGLFYK